MNYMNYDATQYSHPRTGCRLYRAITETGFDKLIQDACAASAPRDAEIALDGDYNARITVERSFAAEATLYIRANTAWDTSEIAVGEDEQQYKINRRRLDITLNWSATNRDLATAAAAIDIYQDLLRLGNHISAVLRGYDLVMVREMPQSQPKEE